MHKINHLAFFMNLVVVIFLWSSIVCSNFSSLENTNVSGHQTLSKKSEASVTNYAQLLLADKEKEDESLTRQYTSNLVFIYCLSDLSSEITPENTFALSDQAPHGLGTTSDAPLYLVKRTFLI